MKRILPANSVLIAIAINFGFASIPILTSSSHDRGGYATVNARPNSAIGAPIRLHSTVMSTAPPIAVANDNRVVAGRVLDDVFTIWLEATEAAWYPEGRGARAVPAYVFRTARGPPQIPGPLIRVPAGTTVRAIVYNTLPETLTLRGLQDRGKPLLDTVTVTPGEARTIRFKANTAGRFYYWGRTETSTARGGASDSQLAGGFIVDPAGANRDTTERVMVLTRWDDSLRVIPGRPVTETYAVNGYMWPHTERLDSAVSGAVLWRVINASRSRYPVRVFADTVLRRWRAIGAK
ncbi:MAG TPA: multicopper oxidase domain-containing protein [Gemmatimonadaceae bacterium]|nr:multicopper oxidase domain-containing protein [Gemmatimonadaceae bacterium]